MCELTYIQNTEPLKFVILIISTPPGMMLGPEEDKSDP